jgi:hypothetical protein
MAAWANLAPMNQHGVVRRGGEEKEVTKRPVLVQLENPKGKMHELDCPGPTATGRRRRRTRRWRRARRDGGLPRAVLSPAERPRSASTKRSFRRSRGRGGPAGPACASLLRARRATTQGPLVSRSSMASDGSRFGASGFVGASCAVPGSSGLCPGSSALVAIRAPGR